MILPDFLSENQKKAIITNNKNLLIVAGPGSGKTEVITRKIGYLIKKEGISPKNILAVTFTRKAAGEMASRVEKLIGKGIEDLNISTIHSFCHSLIEENAEYFGLTRDFRVLDELRQFLLLFNNFERMELNKIEYDSKGILLSDILSHFNKLKDHNITPDEYLENRKTTLSKLKNRGKENEKFIARVNEQLILDLKLANSYKHYCEIMHENKFLDYGDLINLVIQKIKEDSIFKKVLHDKYKYILVDEYQDTNHSQEELLSLLKHSNNYIFVVGDDDQSIYRFRGAVVQNLLHFDERYDDVEVIKLLENYRSTQNIVKVTKNFISKNPFRKEKELFTKNEEGDNVIFYPTTNIENEAEFICQKIQELIERKIIEDFSDVAILFRSVKNYAGPYLERLKKYNIPCDVIGQGGFFDRKDIKDLISIFLYLHKGENTELENIHEITKKKDIKYFSNLKDNYDNKKFGSILEIFYDILNNTSYLKNKILENDDKTVYNLSKFSQIIDDFDVIVKKCSLGAFMSFIGLLKTNYIDEENEDILISNSVNIMTVHQAKGLEFKVVFVPNLIQNKFPTTNRTDAFTIPWELTKNTSTYEKGDIHLMDERRLFYVAMTRAKKNLFLSYPLQIGNRKQKCSQFVLELKNDTYELKRFTNTINQSIFDEIKKIERVVPDEEVKISFTKLLYYILCPLRYKFNFIYNFATPEKAFFSYGISIHHTLAELHNHYLNNGDIDEDKIKVIFEKNWMSEGYSSKFLEDKFKNKATKIVLDYYRNNKDNFELIHDFEKEFNINISGCKIKGVIDLINKKDKSNYEIIDFKSGEIKDWKAEEGALQLSLYALGCKLDLGLNVTMAKLYDLSKNNILEFPISTKNFDEVKKRITEFLDGIRKKDFTPKTQYCSRCEFVDYCPYEKSKMK